MMLSGYFGGLYGILWDSMGRMIVWMIRWDYTAWFCGDLLILWMITIQVRGRFTNQPFFYGMGQGVFDSDWTVDHGGVAMWFFSPIVIFVGLVPPHYRLLGGFFTPVKNGVSSSVGMMNFPTYMESHNPFHGSINH